MGIELFEKYEVEDELKRIEGNIEIDLNKVKDIEEREYSFQDENGERKVKRYIYVMENGDKYIIPKSVHNRIVTLVKEKKVTKVLITVSGSGIKRRYEIIALSSSFSEKPSSFSNPSLSM